ncbi:2,3,4,5-tetrahydropyridine-2,6-dicarboxylate N-acetyltransferase [bioreactor metagenome]|uniref:2,3,4,5-tetrahydropyridine-2,6-dicarboxylate N-acetyltransferase n=1 Tax=bioreactor metagenome TaxID=1076179 RepID=A0A645C1U2_9ZZZZ|nr:acyltransferase [Erysipelotrichales bacterium]
MIIILRMLKEYFYMRDTVKYAKKLGVKVGENCKILANPRKVFGSEPWLINIGNHVEITANVQFVTHDGGVWTLREEYPNIDVFGPIRVGNNVFIGIGATILPNVRIGDNCIIGAGSVITKDIPSNSVVAGAPAKLIKTFGEYIETSLAKSIPTKRMSIQQKEEYLRKEKPHWFSVV